MSVKDTDPTRPRRYFRRQPTVGAGTAVKAVVEDARALVQAEVALAKAELSSALQAKTRGGAFLAVAAVAGWLALQGLLIAAGLALALVMPGWAAALVVSGVLLLVTAIAALLGRRKLATPVSLDTTKQNVAEDVAVARASLGGEHP